MDSLRHVTPAEWKSLIAGGLGWMLDAMDVMLYSLILAYLIRQFGMSTSTAGLLNSLTLVASAIGGLLFGIIAGRIGSNRSPLTPLLVYFLSTAACGFSPSAPPVALLRLLLWLRLWRHCVAHAAP